jgi:arginase family enzyme
MFPAALLQSTFVTVPTVGVRPSAEGVELTNESLGSAFTAGPAAVAILDHFRTPRVLAAALGELDADPQLLLGLLGHAMVIDVDALFAAPQPAIGTAMKLSELLAGDTVRGTVVFGAASDSAVSGRSGARQGPREIRAHTSLPFWPGTQAARPFQAPSAGDECIIDLDFRRQYGAIPPVIDLGTLEPIPGESLAAYGARIRLVASLIHAKGGRTGMLGGDHSTTAFVLDALLERPRPFGILHFDAHHDLTPVLAPTMSYITHGNPFFRALPSPSLVALFQLGLRGVQPMARARLVAEPRISYRSARELRTLTPAQAFAGVSDQIPYYLTFDIDCMDPSIAPETGTPLAGGLSYYQAIELVDYAARRFELIGWDIVEVGQGEGRLNRAAAIAGDLVKTLILAEAPYTPLESYLEESAF